MPKIDAQGKVANPGGRDIWPNTYVISFGAYGTVTLIAYADSLDSALEECATWLEDNAPGVFCDAEVSDAYDNALAEGLDEEAAREQSTVDTISLDRGHYLFSWEVLLRVENPTRDQLFKIFGGTRR